MSPYDVFPALRNEFYEASAPTPFPPFETESEPLGVLPLLQEREEGEGEENVASQEEPVALLNDISSDILTLFISLFFGVFLFACGIFIRYADDVVRHVELHKLEGKRTGISAVIGVVSSIAGKAFIATGVGLAAYGLFAALQLFFEHISSPGDERHDGETWEE